MYSKYAKRVELASGIDAIYNILISDPVYLPHDLTIPVPENTPNLYSSFREKKIVVDSTDADDELLRVIQGFDRSTNLQVDTLYLIVTTKCNLKCTYCFVSDCSKTKGALMSSEIMIKTLTLFQRHLVALGKTSGRIVFYGGEPLIAYKTIQDAINYCNRRGFPMQYEIVTNGVLVNKDVAQFCKDMEVCVGVSIDGPQEIHDANRCFRGEFNRKGSYLESLAGLETLVDCGVTTGISLTLTELSVLHSQKLITWLKSLNPKGVAFNLLHQKQGEVMEECYKDFGAFCISAYEQLHIHDNMIQRRKDSFERKDFVFCECSAGGINQLTVDPDGNAFICHCMRGPDDMIGNVADATSLTAMLEHPNAVRWLSVAPISRPKCRSCMAISICGGGCPANAAVFPEDTAFCAFAKYVMLYLLQQGASTFEKGEYKTCLGHKYCL